MRATPRQTRLETRLETRMEALAAQTGGHVAVADIAGVVTSVMQSLQAADSTALVHTTVDLANADLGPGISLGHGISEELRGLIRFVEAAKAEIFGLKPQTLSKRDIPDASDELSAIVAATEEAAGRMMDVADEIQALATDGSGAGAALADRFGEIATKIYEASSFQDITGQRVTKVMRVLNHLEEKLAALAIAVGDEHVEGHQTVEYVDGEIVNDAALLHGPQLPEAANNQDDIDALLASFD